MEAAQRLDTVVAYLEQILAGQWPSVVTPLWHLWELEAASRKAGYNSIAGICREMETEICQVLPTKMDKRTQDSVRAMITATNLIRMHASSVASAAVPPEPSCGLAGLFADAENAERQEVSRLPDALGKVAGLTINHDDSAVRIEVRQPQAPHHLLEVIWALRQLQQDGWTKKTWIVNLGALSEIPFSLQSVLTIIGRELRDNGWSLILKGLGKGQTDGLRFPELLRWCGNLEDDQTALSEGLKYVRNPMELSLIHHLPEVEKVPTADREAARRRM